MGKREAKQRFLELALLQEQILLQNDIISKNDAEVLSLQTALEKANQSIADAAKNAGASAEVEAIKSKLATQSATAKRLSDAVSYKERVNHALLTEIARLTEKMDQLELPKEAPVTKVLMESISALEKELSEAKATIAELKEQNANLAEHQRDVKAPTEVQNGVSHINSQHMRLLTNLLTDRDRLAVALRASEQANMRPTEPEHHKA
ncbi:hypothetical protein [Shimia thalassica]|uniref:hypothetical protein n=1 Tax=Shimia thalassica TaxID=1715693 RepID=UPI0026E1E8FB|nr:hypothetical protein [Shimia thalassica]MDO6481126.1 hypothetical protein [Shimia thalassica]